MITQAIADRLDKYWAFCPDGGVRLVYDPIGYCHFVSSIELWGYLAERAELNETYRDEFMRARTSTPWLELMVTTYPSAKEIQNKLLVQRTAEKLRGI